MKCYAAFAKNNELRMKGSSGGIFPVIAKSYVEKGAIVYASVYDEIFNVVFARIDNEIELEKSFTSKYLQSRLNDAFDNITRDLKEGRNVLFCGTPCQGAGLRRYLETKKISTESLLIIDIICHGVPSEEVFHKYMSKYIEPKCVSINMRNKDMGWNWGTFAWKMSFSDGSDTTIRQSKIPYMRGFLANLYLRPSCYKCVSKTKSQADITLGDFWGISNVNQTIPAERGVSCVILRTGVGESVFCNIKDDIELWKVSYKDILMGNSNLTKSVNKPANRQKFFRKMLVVKDSDVERLINSMSKSTFQRRIINKVYSKLPKIGTNVSELKDMEEKVIYSQKEQCCGCSACYAICPTNAIFMKKDKEGFLYPVIETRKCINCKLCEKVCPFHN